MGRGGGKTGLAICGYDLLIVGALSMVDLCSDWFMFDQRNTLVIPLGGERAQD